MEKFSVLTWASNVLMMPRVVRGSRRQILVARSFNPVPVHRCVEESLEGQSAVNGIALATCSLEPSVPRLRFAAPHVRQNQ